MTMAIFIIKRQIKTLNYGIYGIVSMNSKYITAHYNCSKSVTSAIIQARQVIVHNYYYYINFGLR